MIAFPDTSFLCAFYRRQDNSPQAAAYFKAMPEALHVSGLLLYEFRQSVRFQVWLHARDKSKGYPQADCDRALADLQTDLETGALRVHPAGSGCKRGGADITPGGVENAEIEGGIVDVEELQLRPAV